MSALKELRDIMSAPLNLSEDYDTDAVSVTDTVSSHGSMTFDTDCIIAERHEDENCYLLSWTGYPLHRCTWEPPAHLDGDILIKKWDQIEQELGRDAFDQENAKNIKAFDRAMEEATSARIRRLAKREKKRRQRQQRHRAVVADDYSSDSEPVPASLKGKDSPFVNEKAPLPSSSTTDHRQRPVARKAPLQQSSSEEDSSADESLMGDPRKRLSGSMPGEKVKQPVTATDTPNPATTDTPNPAATDKPKSAATRAVRTAFQTKPTGAFNFIDQAKEKQQRRERYEDQQYKKVRHRSLAEKKSHTEKPPDFSALTFVNGAPPSLPKPAASRSDDNPYGRREITNRRIQDDEPEDRLRPGLTNLAVPLADWEVHNVPLMCYKWKAGLPCDAGLKDCKFMHRECDPQGKSYPIGRYDGYIEPKYQRPPLTCLYNLKGRCRKPAEQCEYAHWDTGYTCYNNLVIKIEQLPAGYAPPGARNQTSHAILYKEMSPPITCPYWLWEAVSCFKSPDQCNYAHWNTGWVPPESDYRGQAVRIDSNLEPHGMLPKYADPPVTCPFWLRCERRCTRTDDDCIYAHKNTGWAPPGLSSGKPVPIDIREKPRCHGSEVAVELSGLPTLSDGDEEASQVSGQKRSSGPPNQDNLVSAGPSIDLTLSKNLDPPLTCYFWLYGSRSCRTSPEECGFAHRNTGWINNKPLGKPQRIDMGILPRFRKHEDFSLRQRQTNQPARPSSPTPVGKTGVNVAGEMSLDTVNEVMQAPIQCPDNNTVATQDVSQNKASSTLSSSQLRTEIENLWNLDVGDMFNSGRPGDNNVLERHAMLLYSPEDHPQELELITRWLLMHNVKVKSLWQANAWASFRDDLVEDKSGIIIAHPDFEMYTELPGLGQLLKKRVRVWSVGLQLPASYEAAVNPDTPELRRERINIFPHGGLIYITDDVFDKKPQLALRIVNEFCAKIDLLRGLDGPVSEWLEVPDACLLWRLCVRPELMESLFLKCQENDTELAAENPDFMSRYNLYVKLHLTGYIEQDPPEGPVSTIEDKFPILSERREHAEDPALDYFNIAKQSQEEANTRMIGYYATMQAVLLRRDYRMFYVVHTEPDAACAQHWRDSLHNIADVITPEQCVEELSKPSKESLFDFLDWAMGPKDKGVNTRPEDVEPGEAPMDVTPP